MTLTGSDNHLQCLVRAWSHVTHAQSITHSEQYPWKGLSPPLAFKIYGISGHRKDTTTFTRQGFESQASRPDAVGPATYR